jgi:hypothetical protein
MEQGVQGVRHFLRAVDAAENNVVGCHEGLWQSDNRWMGESRRGLGCDYVNRPYSGSNDQSEDTGQSAPR